MVGCACPTAEEQPTHLWACWAAGIQGAGGPGVGWLRGWAGPWFLQGGLQTGSVRASWDSAARSRLTDVGGKPGVP